MSQDVPIITEWMDRVADFSVKYQKKNPHYKDWQTPPEFFAELDKEFHFTMDAAASHENALVSKYCTLDGTYSNTHGTPWAISYSDGLTQSWKFERVFCNPPYDRTIIKWVAKAAQREAEVAVLLLPPSTDTHWFHSYCWGQGEAQPEIRFLKKRLRFWKDGKVGSAPRAGNMLAIFRKEV